MLVFYSFYFSIKRFYNLFVKLKFQFFLPNIGNSDLQMVLRKVRISRYLLILHYIACCFRDRMICSRYFTTESVRSYLGHPERKRQIAHFAQSFIATKLGDEKVRIVQHHVELVNGMGW